jgi:hypothetical protein
MACTRSQVRRQVERDVALALAPVPAANDDIDEAFIQAGKEPKSSCTTHFNIVRR